MKGSCARVFKKQLKTHCAYFTCTTCCIESLHFGEFWQVHTLVRAPPQSPLTSPSPRKVSCFPLATLSSLHSHSQASPDLFSVTIDHFAFSRSLHQRNHTACRLLCLASFSQCNLFEMHPGDPAFLLLLGRILSYWLHHSLCSHSPLDGHRGCF